MAGHRRGLAERRNELAADVVDLDRREAEALHTGDRPCFANEAGERVSLLAIAEAAEVDACENDLGMSLGDALSDLREDCRGTPAASRTAHERDHAERA